MLMGVAVDQIERPFEATLEPVKTPRPAPANLPVMGQGHYLVAPSSNAAFIAVARLQAATIPVGRAVSVPGMTPGTWIVPMSGESGRILLEVSRETGLVVQASNAALAGDVYRLRPRTRIGLWRGANNMPAGWMKWVFEQYGFNHKAIASSDFDGDLSSQYDAIVLPDGTSRTTIVNGLSRDRNDKEWSWAYGVGEAGWKKLADWVQAGGTLVAVGSAVETARALLDLPIEAALPETRAGGRGGAPAPLAFYCPGSLLQNEFNTAHPVAYGMPPVWPVFFEGDQAYRLKPGFTIQSEVVSRYPAQGPILQSGWLLGEEFLRDQANVVAFRVGKGYVVTLGSQVDFRAQPRATFKLLFNAIFHGPSTRVDVAQLGRD
jgi:hypothetical protein